MVIALAESLYEILAERFYSIDNGIDCDLGQSHGAISNIRRCSHTVFCPGSQQGNVQVRIFDASGRAKVICRNAQANLLALPLDIIPKTLLGIPQTGRFQVSTNAIKYAASTKTIQLNILTPVEKNLHWYVPLQIQDHGQGIPTEILQHITKRFYRGDHARPRGGLGLGLAIAHEMCQLQGGRLHLASQPNQGTIVTLLLPCVDERQRVYTAEV